MAKRLVTVNMQSFSSAAMKKVPNSMP